VVNGMISMFAWLHHHICTTYRDSVQSQGQDKWVKWTATIRQGNRVGLQIWAAVSSLLFDIMQEEGFIASLICALSRQQQQMARFAFINNTDLIKNDHDNQVSHVAGKMQQSLQWHI